MSLNGAKGVLKVNLTGQTPLVDISAALLGLDGFDQTATEESNEVGGGGASGVQGSGFVDATCSFTCDENATTVALFVTGRGKEFDYEWSREGTESGKPQQTGKFIAAVNHTFEARGKRRFEVTGEHNGAPTRGTH